MASIIFITPLKYTQVLKKKSDLKISTFQLCLDNFPQHLRQQKMKLSLYKELPSMNSTSLKWEGLVCWEIFFLV